MQYFFVRVVSEDLNNENNPLVVDLLFDGNGDVKMHTPYCGWWGFIKSTELIPFVVKQIDDTYYFDFGSDEQTDQLRRYKTANLLHGSVKVGKRFWLLLEEDDRYEFCVRSMTDMIAGQSFEIN